MNMNLFKYDDVLRSEGVILYFSGPVSQTVVESLAALMRSRMRAENAALASVQRVFAVLVEQMQNIVRYSSECRVSDAASAGEMAQGQVMVGRERDGRFFVACGNRVRTSDCVALARRIDGLRRLSPDELKARYRELRRSSGTDKGAGLGFVEMARKADSPLDYAVEPVDARTSFFSMKVVTQ